MKKKVLFVINTMGRAGAERCLLHLLKAWQDDSYELSLFSVLGRGELFDEVPSHVRILNQTPEKTTVFDKKARKGMMKDLLKGMWKKKILLREIFSMLGLLFWQVKEKKVDVKKLCWKPASDTAQGVEEAFDLAVGYLQGAATYYVMDHVKAAKKVVFLHNDYGASGYCPKRDWPYYEKADKIFCVSNFIAEGLKEIFPDCRGKIEIFYNFADALWVKERAKEGDLGTDGIPMDMKREPGTILLLTAARLEPAKAFDVAIQAMVILKQKNVNACWYVLGDGSLRRELEREIRKQKVEDRFFLLGAKENPYPYMAACDIYVQETYFEGFCTSITEAVILGRKVVASCCGSNREQLAFYGTGMITELNPGAIAEGIERALREEQPKVDVMERQKEELERLKREAWT